MKFPALATVILFCIWLHFTLKKNSNKEAQIKKEFWDRESEANNVRKKSLDDLDYITIPFETLPFGLMPDVDTIVEAENTVKDLSKGKIVNLTGYTNTDLKLKYGTANITPLSEYDQNYTSLVTSLQKWGKQLFLYEKYYEACAVLEFAVQTRTDITDTYKLLCEIYTSKLGLSTQEAAEQVQELIPIAETLNSLSKKRILDTLYSYLDGLQNPA